MCAGENDDEDDDEDRIALGTSDAGSDYDGDDAGTRGGFSDFAFHLLTVARTDAAIGGKLQDKCMHACSMAVAMS